MKKDYSIVDETIEQPVSHLDKKQFFTERVRLLIPYGVTKQPYVLFFLGGEWMAADSKLITAYAAYGRRKDMVIICGEHRGYGKSIFGENQNYPDYVSIKETLGDYHEIRKKYAKRYPGGWIIYGRSYSGSLAIEYAYTYPDDGFAVLSSSGVIDWNATIPQYDRAICQNLGSDLYEQLCVHMDNLLSGNPFDENWYAREIIYAYSTAIGQYRENYRLLPMISALAKLPTNRFIKALKRIDTIFTKNAAACYAESNRALTVSNTEAVTGNFSWRTWRYQQAFQTGTYFAPWQERSIYRHTNEDWKCECLRLFGKEPAVFHKGTEFHIRDMLSELKIPFIYVRGGRDPWREVGLEKDYNIKNGKIISITNGFHCPDSYSDNGPAVIAQVLAYGEENNGKTS